MPAKPRDIKHGMEVWIGVDGDGTLWFSEPGSKLNLIGAPIFDMVHRVRVWLEKGWKVKIFTARASFPEPELSYQVGLINAFCMKHFGRHLEVTNVKDLACEVIWDDRAVSVHRNTGRFLRLNALGD